MANVAVLDDAEEEEDQTGPQDTLARYQELVDSFNIAEDLTDEQLNEIGQKVTRGYDIDVSSRSDWLERVEKAMDVAMQVIKEKNYPFSGAANVKFPLMTVAAIQFAARAYPAIVPGKSVARAKMTGKDPDGQKKAKGNRIAEHMSWQLTEEMEEWEEDTDRLLHIVSIVGCLFRKTYYDPDVGRNRSELILPKNLVVNYEAASLDSCNRVTHEFDMHPNDVRERMLMGIYRDVELPNPTDSDGDEDAALCFLEQHRFLDLDEDGYAEPYVVTIHKDTSEVLRIVARFDLDGVEVAKDGRVMKIKPVQYFTKYGFIPAPDGSFYDVGFGALLNPLNEAINTTVNQMLDAGHLQNTGGGFIGSPLKLKNGQMRFKQGEWKIIQATGQGISNNIVPLNHPGPSPVLFQLLGLLIEAGKEVASVKDILTGEQPAGTPATTTLALIEQGMKVFTAIYKRIHRSLKHELRKLYRLNRKYLPEAKYFAVLDDPRAIARQDYDEAGFDIVPVSDPTVVTDMQRMGRAEFMMQFLGDPAFDGMEIRKRLLEAAEIEDIEALFAKEPPPPDPEAIAKLAKAETDKINAVTKAGEAEAKIAKTKAEIIKLIAEAEAAEVGPQLEQYKAELQFLLGSQKEAGSGNNGRGEAAGAA